MTGLINTLEAPSEFDALTKLMPDEPYFLLIGRDRLAPALVQKWADDNRHRAMHEYRDGKINEERRDREFEKSTQAEAIGWAMTAFKAGDMAKRIVGEPTAKTYSGFELDPETKRRDALQTASIRAASECSEAVALLMEVAELMEPNEKRGRVNHVISLLRQLSDELTPPRPGMKK